MSTLENNVKEPINPHVQKKYREKLEKLLDKHRMNREDKSIPTHVTMDPVFPGRYSLDKTAKKKLHRLIKEGNKFDVNMAIAEKPKEYAPIKVDIDLKVPKEDFNDSRLYDDDFIMKIIGEYRNGIKKISRC